MVRKEMDKLKKFKKSPRIYNTFSILLSAPLYTFVKNKNNKEVILKNNKTGNSELWKEPKNVIEHIQSTIGIEYTSYTKVYKFVKVIKRDDGN
jgi:hypothetical protein